MYHILLPTIALISFLFFYLFLDHENSILMQLLFSIQDSGNVDKKLYYSEFNPQHVVGNSGCVVNDKLEVDENKEQTFKPLDSEFDLKIKDAQVKLKNNLKNLEFIMATEDSLLKLAEKDKCSIERLEEFIRIKKEVQLKIIELSQVIATCQSGKVNLC